MSEVLRRAGLCLLAAAALLLAGCASFGPPRLQLDAADIEARFAGLERFTRQLDGLDVSGPQVGFMPASGRIELAWTAALPGGEGSLPLRLRAAFTGTPELADAGNAIELADVRFEGLAVKSLPFLPALRETRPATIAGRLPLLSIDPDQLRRGDALYQAVSLQVTGSGITVELAPR